MYAMLGTRVDTAFSVSILSRYLANPGPAHIKAAKRVMRYLKRTSQMGLAFRGTLKPLIGYTDADWAGDTQTRRSTSGFLFNIGSGAISWSSKQQPTVSLSTCKAKYIAKTQATKETMWLQLLLSQLLMDKEERSATIIFGDNQRAIALAKNLQFHARTKHIAIQHHFVRKQQTARTVDLQYILIERQVVDGLTKALPNDRFITFWNAVGLEESSESQQ